MWIQVVLFAIGLVMLIKGGDWFVDSASGIARRFHLPELLIGATVVSIGTTLPEVMVSAQGAMAGSGGMAYGNAVGSIICNTSLIAALTIAIKPGKAERKSMIIPVAFFFGVAAFYVTIAYTARRFERWMGFVLLALFVIYLTMTLLSMKKSQKNEIEDLPDVSAAAPVEEDGEEEAPFSLKGLIVEALVIAVGAALMFYKGGMIRYIGIAMLAVFLVYAVIRMARRRTTMGMLREILFLVVGAGVIAGGANLLVDSGTAIAEAVGVPDTVIALTFVALGTSLPELVTAITSLLKGHGALSLGNIIGANLFNLVLVSGVSVAISPFDIPFSSMVAGLPSSLVIDLPVMLGVMLLMTVPALIRQKLSRVQGILLLGIYAAFCTLQFVL
ncbi:MAG: calcium/sodium antiporter [Clostridia bacterium]|nr:calcium/sodium antiporter [Clostridia bacterium]